MPDRTNERAIDYVRDLGPDRVTFAQKNVLRAIAQHYRERYGLAIVELDELSADLMRHPRHLRRIFKSLGHLIEYKPGLGKGNYSQFRFVELGSGNGTERGHKGDISDTAIRKENLNQKPIQKQTPPTPLSSKGGLAKKLTVRQIRQLREYIIHYRQKCGMPYPEAVLTSCQNLCLPLDAAVNALEASGDLDIRADMQALQSPQKLSA